MPDWNQFDAVYDENIANARLCNLYMDVNNNTYLVEFVSEGVHYGEVVCFDEDMTRRVAGEWLFVSQSDKEKA